MAVSKELPITETLQPADAKELAQTVYACYGDDLAVYPVGGGSSLEFGLPPTKPGIALSLGKMNRVVDYPARDMTITLEAGVTVKALADRLLVERQRLPIDVPQAETATIGGVIATNFNGPRRFGSGTVRDYVIGISAVDGRGLPFKGGGRVVKNVAGYDFCKLLTGSLGTIGVITQVTLKVKPIPERLAMLICAPRSWEEADSVASAITQSQTAPAAIALLRGKGWPTLSKLSSSTTASADAIYFVVALEGTDPEVRWMADRLGREWWEQGVAAHETLFDTDAHSLMAEMVEFPAAAGSPMVLKASVVPSGVTRVLAAARDMDPECSVQTYSGNGTIFIRLTRPPAGGMTKGLIGKLQSAAAAGQGTLVVLASDAGEATHQSVWGQLSSPSWLMNAVKREFDPRNILNPGRFVYS